jgi:hypothetical protein
LNGTYGAFHRPRDQSRLHARLQQLQQLAINRRGPVRHYPPQVRDRVIDVLKKVDPDLVTQAGGNKLRGIKHFHLGAGGSAGWRGHRESAPPRRHRCVNCAKN